MDDDHVGDAATDPADDDPEWLEPEDLTDEELGVGVPADPARVAAYHRTVRERAQRFRHLPDEPPPEEPEVTPQGIGGVLRAVRWRTGLSQRELARAARVPPSSVTRLENDAETDVRLSTVVRVVEVAGLRLAVVDDEGTHLTVPFAQDRFHDQADRLLPAHRPVYDPRGRFWWGYGLLQQPDPRHPAPSRVFRGRTPTRRP
ncbi:helix-turn-helix domain-containing protein [Jatrophihabitans sp. YIM 134969]